MTQTDIFEITDQAVQQSHDNADMLWLIKAEEAATLLAKSGVAFTTDKVWQLLERESVFTHEPRALGGVIRKLAREKVIVPTGNYEKSMRAVCHRRLLTQWIGNN